MPFYFFGPRLTGARVSSSRANRVVSTIDGQVRNYVREVDGGGGVVLVANGPKGRGSLGNRVQARTQWAGSLNRYYVQIIDENGASSTAVSTTGISGLAAVVAAHATLVQYITVRTYPGSIAFTGTQTLFPSPGWAFFRGRG